MKGILGKKVGMTQIFDERGEVIPVTVIEAGPCFVAQIKTVERDGYSAVQLGFEETKPKRLTRPQVAAPAKERSAGVAPSARVSAGRRRRRRASRKVRRSLSTSLRRVSWWT